MRSCLKTSAAGSIRPMMHRQTNFTAMSPSYLAAVNRARSGLLELRGDVQKGCAQLTEKLDDLWDRFL